MTNTILKLSAIGAAMILTACGGGGGGDESGGTTPPASLATLKGTAVDELILNGKVKVTKPDGTILVEGRTSATDGTYTLKAGYTGAVIVNVTCDTESKLLIGTTKEACPTDLDLNSVANVSGAEVTVNVSPLTEITYQRAVSLGSGTVTTDSVTKASSEVAVIFGVDPIKSDPTTGSYATIIGAFHTAAETDAGKDLFDVIDAFAEDIKDGVADESGVLGSALAEANVTTHVPIGGSGGYAIPSSPATLTDIIQIKNFIKDLRTQSTTMDSYIQSEEKALGEALESTVLDVRSVTEYIVNIADLVMKAREDNVTTLNGEFEVTFYDEEDVHTGASITQSTIDPNEWGYSTGDKYTGTITLPELEEGIQDTEFGTLNATFSGTLPYIDHIYSPDSTITTQTVSLSLELNRTTEGANITLSDFTIENNGTTAAIKDLSASVGYDKNETFNYLKLHTLTLNGAVGDYEAIGKLSVPEYTINELLKPRGGMRDVEMTYFTINFSCPSNLTIVTAPTLTIGGKSYTHDYFDSYDSSQYNYNFDDIPGKLNESEIMSGMHTDASCATPGETPTTTIGWLEYDTDTEVGNSGYIPSKLSFIGMLKNSKNPGELNATVNVALLNAATIDLVGDKASDRDMVLKVGVNGRLKMPSRPETLLNVGYETKDKDDRNRHSITASYTHDATTLTLAGSLDKAEKNGQFIFTDGAGAEAKFIFKDDTLVEGNAAKMTGSLVTKDGKLIATIEKRDDAIVIKYLNGYFESIF